MISDFTFGADCGPRYLKLELPCKLRSLNVTRCLRNRVQLEGPAIFEGKRTARHKEARELPAAEASECSWEEYQDKADKM
jgi:hypothetical protein